MAPNIKDLSPELLCHIFKYLPLREILSVAMLCKKMSVAVDMHLRLCKTIDFCQNAICGYMPSSITDDHLLSLLKKCPHLETVYGLHPVKIERRRLRKRSALTIPGIIEALSLCFNLKAIETSDLRLFEAIMQHLPQLEIIGHFQNRDGLFPPQASQRLKLQPYPKISSLHLIGVEVPELTAMPHLQHLHLQCVRFTKLQPFRAFLAQNLKSFVMKHCIGPSVPQRYLSLIIALSSSPNLRHLELVRVPLLNGLFQRAVEDSYRHNGFVNLKTLIIAGCKGVLEADLGHLMIVSSKNLETLHIQPSLTKDSLFVSLSFAQCSFPKLENLHLGYIDNLNFPGEWSNDTLISFGLAEIPDTPSSITDSGMKVISQLFPEIKSLTVSNCPHLMVMFQWMPSRELRPWHALTDLTLQKCHCLQLSSFALFISFLPNIRVVILNDMFREPPKGCSHVGLSAGTGLGMSSAVVSNQDEHIAVQGHQQDFEHPGDEDNGDNEREFIDVENDDNPEPHFMVLQRDFFDGEDDADAERDAVADVGGEVEGMVDGEEPRVAEDQPNEASNNELQVNDMNNNNSNSSSSTIENSANAPSASSASDNQSSSKDYSKYCLNETERKPSKSAYVQTDYFDVNSKNTSGIVGSNSFEIEDYDPHKPSTSKAGENLDNSLAQENDTSNSGIDSDFKCVMNRKRENKNGKHDFSKKSKFDENLPVDKGSLKIENDENSSGIKNIGYSNSSCSTRDLRDNSNSIDPFSNKKYAPEKPISNVKLETESNEEFPKASTSKEYESEFFIHDITESNREADLSVSNSDLSKCKSCYVRLEKLENGTHSQGNDYKLQENKVPSKLNSDVVVKLKEKNIFSKDSANSKKIIDENSGCCSSKHADSSLNKNEINSFGQDVEMKPNVSSRVSLTENKSTKRELKVNEVSNNLNSGDLKNYIGGKSDFNATDTFSDSNSIKNENVELWDSNLPSTSRAQIGDDHVSIKEENTTHCRKNECRNSLPANPCLESDDNGTSAGNQNVSNKESVIGGSETVTKSHEITDNITSVKELKNNDDFYVLETNNTDGSIHIVNFSRHESHRTPSCSILVNKISCNGINHNLSKSKTKFKKISRKLNNRRSALIAKPDPSLPSTSKASDNVDLPAAESDCCVSSKKRKYESSVAESNNPTSFVQKFKILKISDTDAAILMKEYSHSNQNGSAQVKISENCSVACPKNIENDLEPLENCESPPSGNNKAETDSYSRKKTRRKRGRFGKGVKKILKDCKMKPNCGNKSSGKSYCRRVQSVPMISMISQGTQATSADIRRSVRLVRRATARARRTVASLRVSSHSSKISAKTLAKRPVNTKPPPEMHDKATSTSDPLLEDDAVQTLQLTSASLLSFSVIACGISDLIIDHCTQLYHVEIQACRILKRLQLNELSPELKQINVSQCPKLSVSALAAPVLSLARETFALVTYEPCMQSYHPGEGEKAILSKTAYNQSVLVCHDLSNIAHDGMQAKTKEKLLEWFRFLSKMHKDLNAVFIAYRLKKIKPCEKTEYPWFHEIRKKYGQYISDDFCFASQYQLLTNNPIFCEMFETSPLDSEFPSYHECAAYRNYSLISNEAVDKYIRMEKKFVGFYIPITDSNQIKFL